ncbi:non-structural polyprotein [Taura syndrome virus]|uniref:Non-structural polyprotein n=1 Tax=Taura syndrome virus TaxID=142102 RepID=Q91NQ2_9VIRU|nr:non-structural polyprotein [Taura syndrome virus]AAK72220.1 non-structural polyprotein [Taura syndrome virus]
MASYYLNIKTHNLRRTPVADRAFYVMNDDGENRIYSLIGTLRRAPAFKVGSRRYKSHIPYRREATFAELCNQFHDRVLPFANPRVWKEVISENEVQPDSMLKAAFGNWEEWPKAKVCEELYSECECGYAGTCYVSVDWLRPQATKCNDCILKVNRKVEYPYHTIGVSGNVVTNTDIVYTGYADVFKCEQCDLLMGAWAPNDIPALTHNIRASQCVQFKLPTENLVARNYVLLCEEIERENIPVIFQDYSEGNVFTCRIVSGDLTAVGTASNMYTARDVASKNLLDQLHNTPNVHMHSLHSLPYENFPCEALEFAVEQGIIPPVTFDEVFANDEYVITISCSLLVVADVGPTQAVARERAAKRFLKMYDYSASYPSTHMFTLSTLPRRSGETLELANATLNHVNNVIDRHDEAISNVRQNVEVKLTGVSRQVGAMLPKVETAIDDVSSTLSSFRGVLDKISAWMPSSNPKIIDLIKETFVSLFFAILTKSLYPIIQGISSYALRNNLMANHLTALSEWLMTLKYDSPDEEEMPSTHGFMDDLTSRLPGLNVAKAQAATIYESIGTGLCVALSGILSFIAVMCLGITDLSAVTFNKLLTQSSLVGRALVGVRSFKDVFFGIWDYVDNQVCEILYGKSRKNLDLLKEYPSLDSLLSIFNYFHDTVDANVLISCNRAACELLVNADNLYQGYLDKSITLMHREISSRLKEARNSVKDLIAKAQVYLTCGDGSRVPPVVVYMYGDAGCGKTELSMALQDHFATKCFGEVPKKDVIYSRKAENEFWDGVKQSHKIIAYDDVLQIVDSAQKPNPELFEFIRLNNSDPYQVHMSSVRDKANTFIAPSFVFATSNVNPGAYVPKSIHSADAFRRRLDLCVYVDVKDEFARIVAGSKGHRKVPCEQKIWLHQNPGKTQQDMKQEIIAGTYKITPETAVYELHVDTTLAGNAQSKVCAYDGLVSLIEQVRKLRVAAHSDKVETDVPVLPTRLHELSQETFPNTHAGVGFQFATDWLGDFDRPVEALSYLNETLEAHFVSRSANDGSMFIPASEVADLLCQRHNNTNLNEELVYLTWMTQITDKELASSLVYFTNNGMDKSIWKQSAERSAQAISQCKNAWTRINDFLKNHWISISAVIGSALLIGGVSSAVKCATKCRVRKILQDGGSIMQLVGVRSCMYACQLCKRIKNGDLRLRVRNRSEGVTTFVPGDIRRVARHVISAADVCEVPVHHSFIQSLCDEAFTVHSDKEETFSILDFTPEAKGRNPLESAVVESHQDYRAKTAVVESHQDFKPKGAIVESTRDTVFTESHQDVRVKLHPQVESHQDFRAKNPTVESRKPDYQVEWTDLRTESSDDRNAQDISNRILSRNFVRLYVPGSSLYTHGLFAYGRMLLMPKHMFDMLNGSVEIVSIADKGNTRVHVKIQSHKTVTRGGYEVDIVICEMGNSISARKDITSYFPTVKELPGLTGMISSGRMRVFSTAKFKASDSCSYLMPQDFVAKYIAAVDHITSKSPEKRSYFIRQGFEAESDSMQGDCCSPYVLFNSASRAKIVGLHCAGFDGTARVFAQIITQEDIMAATPTTHAGRVTTEFPHTSLRDSPLPNSMAIGSVKTAPNPTKSEITRSPIHGCFPVLTAPATLYSPTENLLIKNAMKVTKNVELLEEDLIDACVHDVKRILNAPGVSNAEKRVLTHEESITGIENRQYMNALNRSTSAGFPYSSRKAKGKSGKQTWLGSEEFIVDNPDLKEHVEKIVDKAKDGIVDVSLGIFAATLKDERRPLKKVQANKTRVFAASNQGLALALRRYYLSFLDHVMTNRIDNEIGLGVNVYSYDWTRIVNKLKRVGDKVIAGDFSNFDGSLNSQILSRVSEIVTDWYGDDAENGLIRHTLLEYLFNATWLMNGKVFQLNHSQPSGNPLTTLINCVYNMIIFRYVYLLAQRENGFPMTLSGFTTNVACIFYGDDSLCSVSDKVSEWFNQHVITRLMAATGHEYTDETKSGSPPPYRSLSEVTFLKREFVLRDHFWIAPLSRNTIEDMCMWSRKNIDAQDALLQTTRIASFEASLHEKGYFLMFCDVIKIACRNAGYKEACLHELDCKSFLLAQQGRAGAHDSEFLSQLLDLN